MRWSQAKTILIVFFIIIDLFLLFYLTYDKRASEESLLVVTQNAVELLESNGILADADKVKENSKLENMKTVYVENIVKDHRDFAKLVWGDSVQKKSDNHYTGPNGEIKFFGDSFEITAFENELVMVAKKGINSIRDAVDTAKELLENMGVDMKNAKTQATEQDGGYTVSVRQSFNKCEVFDGGITLIFSKTGIDSVKGCWYNKGEGNNTSVKLKTLGGVLIDYMNSTKKLQKEIKITDIEIGYKAGEGETHHESLVLTPVWKITDNKGKSLYIDAREN